MSRELVVVGLALVGRSGWSVGLPGTALSVGVDTKPGGGVTVDGGMVVVATTS